LSALTTVVDLSTNRPLKRCNLLALHRAKGASDEAPSKLHKLCGKVATHHTGGQNFCSVHKQSMEWAPSRRAGVASKGQLGN
jgi:hypothetical protein